MSKQQGKELKKIATILGLPKNAKILVEMLGNLSGWSKRDDLIYSEMEKILHHRVQQKTLTNLLQDLVSLELIEFRAGQISPRVHLMREVWDYPAALFEGIKDLTLSNLISARADITEKGIRKKVKQDAIEANSTLNKLPNRFWRAVVATTLFYNGSKEWKFVNQKLERMTGDASSNTLGQNAAKDSRSQTSLSPNLQQSLLNKEQVVDGLHYSDAQRLDAYSDLSRTLDSWQEGQVIKNHLRASITSAFPYGRKQTVWVSVRKNLADESICWLGSLCGKLDSLDANVLDILILNDQPHTHKIAVHNINGELYIICTDLLYMRNDWTQNLPRLVFSLSTYADHLENKYWSEDIY